MRTVAARGTRKDGRMPAYPISTCLLPQMRARLRRLGRFSAKERACLPVSLAAPVLTGKGSPSVRQLSFEQAMAHPCRLCEHAMSEHFVDDYGMPMYFPWPDCLGCFGAVLDKTGEDEARYHVYSPAALPAWAAEVFIVPLYGYAARGHYSWEQYEREATAREASWRPAPTVASS